MIQIIIALFFATTVFAEDFGCKEEKDLRILKSYDSRHNILKFNEKLHRDLQSGNCVKVKESDRIYTVQERLIN